MKGWILNLPIIAMFIGSYVCYKKPSITNFFLAGAFIALNLIVSIKLGLLK